MEEDQQQINLPSLVVILVLSGLIIRYLFFSSPAGGARQGAAAAAAAARSARGDPAALVRSREAAVERIQQMFPQVDRRTVLWDLQRTGGSVAATTERILAGRLETVRFYSSCSYLTRFDAW
jgi:coupling of ubiquitin conjugation to ER degradation protein 1